MVAYYNDSMNNHNVASGNGDTTLADHNTLDSK
jgi:hypothetical protein